MVSSERLSKNERRKVQDSIFADKDFKDKEIDNYNKLELIDEKSEQDLSNRMEMEEHSEETEYEYEYVEEEYPEGTPMEEIMKGCKKGDVVLPD